RDGLDRLLARCAEPRRGTHLQHHRGPTRGTYHQRAQFRRSLCHHFERRPGCSYGRGAARLFALFAGPFAADVFARGDREGTVIRKRGEGSALAGRPARRLLFLVFGVPGAGGGTKIETHVTWRTGNGIEWR